jgi:hypothetical protein
MKAALAGGFQEWETAKDRSTGFYTPCDLPVSPALRRHAMPFICKLESSIQQLEKAKGLNSKGDRVSVYNVKDALLDLLAPTLVQVRASCYTCLRCAMPAPYCLIYILLAEHGA